MNLTNTPRAMLDRLKPLQSVVFAFVTALVAELMLQVFMEHGDRFSRFGRMVTIFLSLYVIHRFATVAFRSYKPLFKDLCTLLVVLIFAIVTVAIGKLLGLSVATYLSGPPNTALVDSHSFNFAIPYAAGGLLLQAVLGLHYGLVFALSFSVVVGVYLPDYAVLIPYTIISTLVGCLSLTRFRSRSAYLRAGFNVSLIALPFSIVSLVFEPSMSGTDVLVRLCGACASGVVAAFLAAGLTPLLEYLGGYVTDLRLIEMATLDHPLLKDLSVQCPGTWNHSMVMGMMVEAGASAINANPVLARVGAYFHDIGKMKKPMYFVENQGGEENRHDKLSPSMSALIIRSHVKDGIELAHRYKLPESIVDMIPQHHGTSLIEYFYDKACNEAEQEGEDPPDQALYSYPGPRPQTREAGLLMLADGIEAAARTLTEPSLDRIQGLVQKMINKVFSSGELDECELTLKDLHAIAKSFTRVLNGIYHQRIAYAEPAEKVHERDEEVFAAAEELAGGGAHRKSKGAAEGEDDSDDSKEDLKRLGL